MKNKMATPLKNAFSTIENQVSQCDDQTLRSFAETLTIHPARFEQLLSGGSTSPLHVHKHSKVGVARAPLATSWKQVSFEINKILCEPITPSHEAKQTLSLTQSQQRPT